MFFTYHVSRINGAQTLVARNAPRHFSTLSVPGTLLAFACNLGNPITVFFVGALELTVPSPAHAEDDASTQEAKKRFLEGVRLFEEKKYEPARAAFLQAYALKKHSDVLLNIAHCEFFAGRFFESVQHFKDFLRNTETTHHPKRAEAERALKEARGHIGQLRIELDVPDAKVVVDGAFVGNSPFEEPLDVPAGAHSVEATQSGRTTTQNIIATAGTSTTVSLQLAKPTPAVPSPTSLVLSPPAKPVREPFVAWVLHSPIAYAGTALTVIGIGVGVGFVVGANQAARDAANAATQIRIRAGNDDEAIDRDRVKNPCASPVLVTTTNYGPPCNQLRRTLDDESFRKTFAMVSFVAAGVGLSAVIAGYFLTASHQPKQVGKAGPSLRPWVSQSLTGFVLTGTY